MTYRVNYQGTSSTPIVKTTNIQGLCTGFRSLLLLGTFLLLTSTAFGQFGTWTGAADNNWNNSANWFGGIVPNFLFVANIPGGQSNYPIITGTVNTGLIIVAPGGELTINASGTLNLSTPGVATGNGFLSNFGTVENSGTLTIASNGGNGIESAIYNEGTFDNLSGASIEIEGHQNNGIHSLGTFLNFGGTINIGTTTQIAQHGIIVDDGTFTNQGVVIGTASPGIINIDNVANHAIQVASDGSYIQANNSAQLFIGTNDVIGQYGIENFGTTDLRGTVEIAECGWSGIFNRTGGLLRSLGGTINIGTIGIAAGHGIRTDGIFTNSTTINIHQAAYSGVTNNANGVFTNASGATLNVGSSAAVGEHGIYNESTINNSGTINIRRSVDDGLENEGAAQFNNNNGSNLLIGTVEDAGGHGIDMVNGSSFVNDGTIRIERTGFRGINCSPDTEFTNNSGKTISIGTVSTGTTGIFVNWASAVFTNDGGTINIDNTGSRFTISEYDGIYVRNGAIIENKNGGQILIGQNGSINGAGIHLSNADCELVNNNGIIRIDDTALEGIRIVSSSKVNNTNFARMFIGQNGSIGDASAGAIEAGNASAEIRNEACAEMHLYDFIRLDNTPYINNGFLFLDTDQAHSNTAFFINGGVINYRQDNFIPNVTNADIIISPVSTSGCTLNPALEIGVSIIHTPSSIWYIDTSMTIAGGTYDHATNTFIAFSPQNGTTTYYFTVSGAGCTYNAVIDVTFNLADPGIKTWVGDISTDWTEDCNWSPLGVPSSTDDVLIPQQTNAPVIGSSTTVAVQSISVESNAVLTINNGATLNINSSSADGILNAGTVNNGGTINIGSISDVGIENSGTFTNQSSGKINIDQTGDDGITVLSGGTFNNDGLLYLGQSSTIGGNAIENSESFLNNTCGEIRIKLSADAPLENINGAVFTNSGLVVLNSALANRNTGTFTNNGVMVYQRGTPVPNLINNDLIVTTDLSTGCSFNSVTQMGGSNDFTPASTWYTNTVIPMPGGTYSAASNTFTGNFILEGDNVFLFEITGNGCSFDVEINLIGQAINPGAKVWTGEVGDNWADPCNWSPGNVPGIFDFVLIPSALNLPTIDATTAVIVESVTVSNGALLEIEAGGQLTIHEPIGTALTVNGVLNNDGTIIINDSDGNGIRVGIEGVFTNTGTINIGQNGGLDIDGAGIFIDNDFYNNVGGLINIGETAGDGIYLSPGGLLSNAATINIGRIGTANDIGGAGIEGEDRLLNLVGSTININETVEDGIQLNGAAYFSNEGTVNIGLGGGAGNIGDAGMAIEDASVDNSGSGEISIANATNVGVLNNRGNINNEACAKISLFNLYRNLNGGSFNNDGLISYDVGLSGFFTVTNNGVVVDVQGTFDGSSNSNIIVAPILLSCALNGALDIAGTTSFTILDEWFLDPSLTNKAGDYDATTNTFMPSNLSTGANTLYFNISHGSCTYPVTIEVSAIADIDNSRTFLGTASNSWADPCNWASGLVPTEDYDVITANPLVNRPIIQTGTVAFAKSVTIESGKLDIEEGATLSINGASSAGIMNHGELDNFGTIIIENVGGYGINNTDFVFHRGGEIRIDNANGGIQTTGGPFVIDAGAVINIGQNIGINGKGILNGRSFNNSGEINIDNTSNDAIETFSLFTSTGAINIGLNSVAGSNVIDIQSYFANAGTLQVDNTQIRAQGFSAYFITDGILAGNATINISAQSLSELVGIFSPGFSPGEFIFQSALTTSAEEPMLLEIEIEGTSAGSFDYIGGNSTIDVSGISLGLNINYTPADGDQIRFLEATSVVGTFATIENALPTGWTLVYDTDFIAVEYAAALPVELLSFEAIAKNQAVELLWETATETNNEGFKILHSINGLDWQEIGFVVGSGNAQQRLSYSFLHSNPAFGNNYYRLRQMDYDGQFSDSDIRLVNFTGKLPEIKVDIYPNPSKDYAWIAFSAAHAGGSIEITNLAGQSMYQSTISAGETRVPLDVRLWPAGMYVVSAQLGAKIFSQKLIIADH